MACPTITTGDRFLVRLLDHFDCQAQTLGSLGFQSLVLRGSPAEAALTGLLTLFVALFAIRMLFGPGLVARDAVRDVLYVAIVLTLALSWPAYRTLVYDLVIHAPGEIAAAISGPDFASSGIGLAERLQKVDTEILALTASGTGRNGAAMLDYDAQVGGFRAIALHDEAGFGYARIAFLAGTIAPLVALRLGAGLLLALAPLATGLLLFEATRGLFAGWLRGLVFATLGALALTVVLSAQLAVLEPWLADALRLRSLRYAVPSAPAELLAIALAFPLASAGLMWVMMRIAFYRGWSSIGMPMQVAGSSAISGAGDVVTPRVRRGHPTAASRAFLIAESVRSTLRREGARAGSRTSPPPIFSHAGPGAPTVQVGEAATRARGPRRTMRRASATSQRRDTPS